MPIERKVTPSVRERKECLVTEHVEINFKCCYCVVVVFLLLKGGQLNFYTENNNSFSFFP